MANPTQKKASKPKSTAKPKAVKAASKASVPAKATKAAKASPKTSPKTVNGKAGKAKVNGGATSEILGRPQNDDGVKLSPFLRKQREKLLTLRDAVLDSMMGVAKDNLRARAEGSEASAFGMHQADAGSDAYDRDFALNLLSQEQDALYEIDEALKRLDAGTYGVCEMSGKPIPHARLEAIPFARFTVECQSQIERQNKLMRMRQPVTSLFGLTDEDSGDGDDDDSSSDSKD